MADPLSIIVAVATVANIASRAYRIVGSLQGLQSAKVDQIYHRLFAERVRTAGWLQQMRRKHGDQPLAEIHPDWQPEVQEMIIKMQRYHEEAQVKFKRLRLSEVSGFRTYEVLKAKIIFLNGGYDTLLELAKTISAINKALAVILEQGQVPAYDHSDLNSPAAGVSLQSAVDLLQEDGSSIPPPPPFSNPPLVRPQTQSNSREDHDDLEILNSISNQVVQETFQTALGNMVAIAAQQQNSRISLTKNRLALWGSGLFEDSGSLDTILASNDEHLSSIREGILKAFTLILVIQESYLKKNHTRGFEDSSEGATDATPLLLATSKLLSSPEIVPYAATYSVEFQLLKNIYPDELAHISKRDALTMSSLVESLFVLYPAIAALRRVFAYSKVEPVSNEAFRTDPIEVVDEVVTACTALERRDEEIKRQGIKQTPLVIELQKRIDQIDNMMPLLYREPGGSKVAVADPVPQWSKIIAAFATNNTITSNDSDKAVSEDMGKNKVKEVPLWTREKLENFDTLAKAMLKELDDYIAQTTHDSPQLHF